MRRRTFMKAIGGVAAAGLIARAAGKPKLNVLFIAVDDLRPQLGCYGQKHIESPNIDKLAAGGLLFERAFCQQAVCAPSRASLMSGLRPDSTKVWDLHTPLVSTRPNINSIPAQFRKFGYETSFIGKIYHHYVRDDPRAWSHVPRFRRPKLMGGHYRTDAARKAVAEDKIRVEKVKEDLRRKGRKISPFLRPRGPATECSEAGDEDYQDGMIATIGMEELNRLKDKPFFLAVGFLKPHLPFVAPRKYWDMYKAEEIKLADNPFAPKNCPRVALMNWGELRSYSDMPKSGDVTEAQARTLIHGYNACVSYTDAQVGRVVGELDRLGLRDRTVIILWGDHGWKLGDHGMWCKHTNFEIDARVPMIISAPGFKGGLRTKALSEFVDIYPTLCELCGVDLPDHLEGTSFVPLMKDPDREWKTAAFSQYPRGKVMGYSMRTDRYRFTQWIDKRSGKVRDTELYDLEKDPRANVNVAGEASNADLVKDLAKRLKAGWKAARPEA